MLDRDKLLKLLMLTTSDVDPEALSAIRMANSLIKKSNFTWDKILSVHTISEPSVRTSPVRPTTKDLAVTQALARFRNSGIDASQRDDRIIINRNDVSIIYYPITNKVCLNGQWHRWSMNTLLCFLRNN